MAEVDLEPVEIQLIMIALNKLHETVRLDEDALAVTGALAFKLGGAMAGQLLAEARREQS